MILFREVSELGVEAWLVFEDPNAIRQIVGAVSAL